MTTQFNNLKPRLVTAGFMIAVTLSIILISNYFINLNGSLKWLCPSIVFVLLTVAAFEYLSIAKKNEITLSNSINNILVSFLPILFFVVGHFCYKEYPLKITTLEFALVSFLLLFFLVVIRLKDSLEVSSNNLLEPITVFILFAIGGVALLEVSLKPLLLLWLLLTVCFNDAGAYFTGSYFKGKKLAPAISPNKTITGSLGGIVIGGLIGTLTFNLLIDKVIPNLMIIFLISCLVVVFAQFGDLIKSILKRILQVKDSSSILPGHGGILDRLDSVLLGSVAIIFLLNI